MTNKKKIIIPALLGAVLILAGAGYFYFKKTPRIAETHYENGSTPQALKARENGGMPKWLPVTVADVYAHQNLVNNNILMSFKVDEKTDKDISETCVRTDKSRLKLPEKVLTQEAKWWNEKTITDGVAQDKFRLMDCGNAENMSGDYYMVLTDTGTGMLWNR